MRQTAILFAIATFLVPSSLRAQDLHTPEEHLEFVRKLREKGYVELAMEHLEELRKNPPAGTQQIISYEIAKTRLLQAQNVDPEERLVMVDQARAELAAFLKANPQSPEAAGAAQELRKLSAEQGTAMLSLALRQRGTKAQQEKASQAEKYFLQANADIEAFLKTAANQEQRKQAMFDQGVNLMELARTCIDTNQDDINRKRVDTLTRARAFFEALKDDPGKLGFLSKAWLIKCLDEAEPLLANQYYEQLRALRPTEATIPASAWPNISS